jgi:hypothetical protein
LFKIFLITGACFIPVIPAQAGIQAALSWTPACAHARQLKSFKRRSCGGSGFPGAIFVAGMISFRGWPRQIGMQAKAASTVHSLAVYYREHKVGF